MRFFPYWLLALLPGLLLITSCEEDDEPIDLDIVERLESDLNPSGVAPLTALLRVETSQEVFVRMRVVGQKGPDSDVVRDFPEFSDQFTLPVLGLYPNYLNRVELTFLNASGQEVGEESIDIQTQPLISDMPVVTINFADYAVVRPGYNLVNYFGHDGDFLPQRPFLFDVYGDIRWYLDYSNHPVFSTLFYDNGMQRLRSGNFFFGDGNSGALYEINMLGEVVNSWSLRGYGFHHHVIEKPNGNFLVTVNDPNKPTVEDVIIEIDRANGEIVNTWDLNLSLDNARRAWPTDLANLDIDWFHANALAYEAKDDAIIVSGRTQGVVKLTADNEVVWILAPHREWSTAGNGVDLNTLLLQPLDANNDPITDAQVLDGAVNHPDFEWSWYQHSPVVLPNGNIMLFDNGDNRHYQQPGTYSRAVEYAIDEDNLTIQQVWSYGKERGGDTYSRIVSKVSYFPEEEHVLFTPGAVNFQGETYGKVVEVDHRTGRVVYEVTITPPQSNFNIAFHNVLRTTLYPD